MSQLSGQHGARCGPHQQLTCRKRPVCLPTCPPLATTDPPAGKPHLTPSLKTSIRIDHPNKPTSRPPTMAAPTSALDPNALSPVSPPDSSGVAVELDSHPVDTTGEVATSAASGDAAAHAADADADADAEDSLEPMSRDVEGGAGWQRAEVCLVAYGGWEEGAASGTRGNLGASRIGANRERMIGTDQRAGSQVARSGDSGKCMLLVIAQRRVRVHELIGLADSQRAGGSRLRGCGACGRAATRHVRGSGDRERSGLGSDVEWI